MTQRNSDYNQLIWFAIGAALAWIAMDERRHWSSRLVAAGILTALPVLLCIAWIEGLIRQHGIWGAIIEGNLVLAVPVLCLLGLIGWVLSILANWVENCKHGYPWRSLVLGHLLFGITVFAAIQLWTGWPLVLAIPVLYLATGHVVDEFVQHGMSGPRINFFCLQRRPRKSKRSSLDSYSSNSHRRFSRHETLGNLVFMIWFLWIAAQVTLVLYGLSVLPLAVGEVANIMYLGAWIMRGAILATIAYASAFLVAKLYSRHQARAPVFRGPQAASATSEAPPVRFSWTVFRGAVLVCLIAQCGIAIQAFDALSVSLGNSDAGNAYTATLLVLLIGGFAIAGIGCLIGVAQAALTRWRFWTGNVERLFDEA